jgi:hypothetical protein
MPRPTTDEDDGDEVVTLNDGDTPDETGAEDDGNTLDDAAPAAAPAVAAPAAAAPAPKPGTTTAADDIDAEDGADGKKPPPNFVPRARLNELTEANNELRRQNEQILAALAAGTKPAAATPAAAAPASFDIDATLAARNEAQVMGDDAKVLALDRKLFDHQMAEAARIAREQITATDNERTQRQTAEDLKRAGTEVKGQYPQFDNASDQADPRAIGFVVAERQRLIDSGLAPGEALRQAASDVAKMLGLTAKGAGPAPSPTDSPATARTILARTRNAAAALAQPVDLGGIGNRAQKAQPSNVIAMSDAELAALPLSEIRKLDGSE